MTLQFAELDALIETLMPFRGGEPLFALDEKVTGVLMLLGAAVALVGAKLIPMPLGGWVVLLGLVVELSAGLWMIWLSARREPMSFKANRTLFAAELDQDFVSHGKIVAWLTTFPRSELEARRHYVEQRRATLDQRLGFLVGSLDRLGALPLIAAIYLQVKDVRFNAPADIGILPSLLVVAMLMLYWVGALSFSLKLRLTAYERYLADAMAVCPEPGDDDAGRALSAEPSDDRPDVAVGLTAPGVSVP